MSAINRLGDAFNLCHSATTTARRVSLRDCSGIGFYVAGASAATGVTITEATAQTGGASQTLPGTFVYYTMANGAGVWTQQVAAASGSINTIANVAAGLYVFIPQGALSDGFSYLAASHATGTIMYIMSDLDVGRKPTNLRSVDA
jgi:hypothetical protein